MFNLVLALVNVVPRGWMCLTTYLHVYGYAERWTHRIMKSNMSLIRIIRAITVHSRHALFPRTNVSPIVPNTSRIYNRNFSKKKILFIEWHSESAFVSNSIFMSVRNWFGGLINDTIAPFGSYELSELLTVLADSSPATASRTWRRTWSAWFKDLSFVFSWTE